MAAAADSKSAVLANVRVRVPPLAPVFSMSSKKKSFSFRTAFLPRSHPEGWRAAFILVFAAAASFVSSKMLSAAYAANPPAGVSDVCGFAAGVLGAAVWPLLAAAWGALFFWRDPGRVPDGRDPRAFASPADGRICAIEETDGGRLKISIYTPVCGIHILRAPCGCDLVSVARRSRRRCEAAFRSMDGMEFTVATRSKGALPGRVTVYSGTGDRLERGERCGIALCASRTDVMLPAGSEPLVLEGQTAVAGETAIARFPAGERHE